MSFFPKTTVCYFISYLSVLTAPAPEGAQNIPSGLKGRGLLLYTGANDSSLLRGSSRSRTLALHGATCLTLMPRLSGFGPVLMNDSVKIAERPTIASRNFSAKSFTAYTSCTTATRTFRDHHASRFLRCWENAMSAVAVAKVVFADRKIGADQLPAASPSPLPLDKEAEAKRATNVEQ